MGINRIIGLLALLVFATAISGQSISVMNNPVPPGSTAHVSVANSTASNLGFLKSLNPLHVFQPTGELAFPFDIVGGFQGWMYQFGSMTLSLAVPNTGPGSSGSYVIHYMDGDEAVARLDVGSPAVVFPSIHCWPANSHDYLRGHASPAVIYGTSAWKFANVSAANHTFGSGDTLFVFRPTHSAPIRTVPLAGMTVPAGGVLSVDVSILPLVPGPIRLLAIWSDPGTNQVEMRSHGLRRQDTRVDLHLPGGKTLALNQSLPVVMASHDFPSPGSGGTSANPPFFALLAALSPGEIFLGPNLALPLDPTDPLVVVSLQSGLGGILFNNVGQGLPATTLTQTTYTGAAMFPFTWIIHPNDPSVAGMILRLAAVAFDPVSGTLGVSQREELVVE